MHLFGPVFVMYFIDYNYICYNYQLVSQKKKKRKKNSLMAQMMTDVLFRPVFITATFPSCITIYISYKHQLVSKKKKKKIKKLTYGPNDNRCIVQAHFRPSHHVLQYIYPINISQYLKKRREKRKKNSLMAQMTPDASVWACFCHVFHRLQLYML